MTITLCCFDLAWNIRLITTSFYTQSWVVSCLITHCREIYNGAGYMIWGHRGGICSFTNNICTAITSHPYFVEPASIDINSVSHGKGHFLGTLIIRVCDGQLPSQDEMGGETRMGMRTVMSIAAATSAFSPAWTRHKRQDIRSIGPGKDMVKTP